MISSSSAWVLAISKAFETPGDMGRGVNGTTSGIGMGGVVSVETTSTTDAVCVGASRISGFSMDSMMVTSFVWVWHPNSETTNPEIVTNCPVVKIIRFMIVFLPFRV